MTTNNDKPTISKMENIANNVAQRNSQDYELMKKIFPHKEVINGKIVSVFPYIEEVYPLKDVPQEVVSKMETTTLTEQWKKGELEQGWYYVKNEFGNIFISEYSKDYDFIGERVISGFFTEVSEIIEIICEVPDYIEWKNYVAGFCDEHEYNLKLLEENQNLRQFCEEFNALNVAEENQKLKELLKDSREFLIVHQEEDGEIAINNVCTSQMIDKIDEELERFKDEKGY